MCNASVSKIVHYIRKAQVPTTCWMQLYCKFQWNLQSWLKAPWKFRWGSESFATYELNIYTKLSQNFHYPIESFMQTCNKPSPNLHQNCTFTPKNQPKYIKNKSRILRNTIEKQKHIHMIHEIMWCKQHTGSKAQCLRQQCMWTNHLTRDLHLWIFLLEDLHLWACLLWVFSCGSLHFCLHHVVDLSLGFFNGYFRNDFSAIFPSQKFQS